MDQGPVALLQPALARSTLRQRDPIRSTSSSVPAVVPHAPQVEERYA
jgi:hypothetical protein